MAGPPDKTSCSLDCSPGAPHQLARELRRDNLSTNRFGLIGHTTDEAGEWDADPVSDLTLVSG